MALALSANTDALLVNAAVGDGLNPMREQRQAVFAVPGEVPLDLAVVVATHRVLR
jgi:hypothetical protein